MQKKIVVPILLFSILLTLACSISMEGIAFGEEQEPYNSLTEIVELYPEETIETEEVKSSLAEATAEPEYKSAAPEGSDMERVVSGSHEYSAVATNFDCICQPTSNMTVDFNFTGNQVEITNAGGAPMVYDKIGENKYKRSFMGYYILTSGEGDQATETQVEEERHTVIVLTGNGYIMENYKGASGSACCTYNFTIEK